MQAPSCIGYDLETLLTIRSSNIQVNEDIGLRTLNPFPSSYPGSPEPVWFRQSSM